MADLTPLWSCPDEPFDCLYLLTAEGQDPLSGLALPGATSRAVKSAIADLGVRGVEGEVLITAGPAGEFRRIACFGVGKPENLNVSSLRKLLRRLLEQAGRNREYQIGLGIAIGPRDVDAAERRLVTLAELALADYRFDRFRSRTDEATKVDGVAVVPLVDETQDALAGTLERAKRIDSLVRLARDLGNRPGNDLTPPVFAEEVVEMFKGGSVRATVMTRKELEKDGLHGIVAVGQGSVHEPCMVRLEYRAKKPRAAVVLVGKGVTFDSGGICLKAAGDMTEMKHDMCGAASVVAAMQMIAMDEPPLKVAGLIPLVENMPSGSALRPGDILTMGNGVTVEIENTDAEGRLILADAMAWAARLHPDIIVDLATLTGTCKMALGSEFAGMFCNDDELAGRLERLGRQTGDRVWRLPLAPQYRELLKSEWADIKNSGGRWGSLPSSASFLARFVPEGVRWAHLDIAGVAYGSKAHNGLPAGATGFGVRLLGALLQEMSAAL